MDGRSQVTLGVRPAWWSALPGVGTHELEEPVGDLPQLGVVVRPDLPDGKPTQAPVGQDHLTGYLNAVPAGRSVAVLKPADAQPDGPDGLAVLAVLNGEVRAAPPLPYLFVRPLRRLRRHRVVVLHHLVEPLHTQGGRELCGYGGSVGLLLHVLLLSITRRLPPGWCRCQDRVVGRRDSGLNGFGQLARVARGSWGGAGGAGWSPRGRCRGQGGQYLRRVRKLFQSFFFSRALSPRASGTQSTVTKVAPLRVTMPSRSCRTKRRS